MAKGSLAVWTTLVCRFTLYPMTSITSLDELANFVNTTIANLVPAPAGATVLGLIGDLGVGKTTFVQLLAKALGVTEVVTSPTYLIMRSYETQHPLFTTLVHIDAYRIEDLSELAPLRFSEVLAAPGTLVCIEWADRLTEALPQNTTYLTFTLQTDGVRTITS